MDIQKKLVKEFGCQISNFIASNVNKCINEDTYVDALKKADIRPLYKKDWELQIDVQVLEIIKN